MESTKYEVRSAKKRGGAPVGAALLIAALLPGWHALPLAQAESPVPEVAQAEPGHSAAPQAAPAPEVQAAPEQPAPPVPDVLATPAETNEPTSDPFEDEPFSGSRSRPFFRLGQDIDVPVGRRVREVVTVMGSATIAGTVDRDVVVTMGNVRLEPTARIGGNLVVTMGDVSIADGAVVERDLVATGGTVSAPPGFSPGREYVVVGIPGLGIRFNGFVDWVTSGLIWGRLIVPSIGWIWIAVALAVLLYFLINLVFSNAVKACAIAVGERPLSVFLTGLLVLILVGPVGFLLGASIIGIPVIPFVLCGLLIAVLVGKVGVTRWLGSAIVAEADPDDRAQATRSFLIGTVLILVTYTIPVAGILAWVIGSTFGLGAATIAFSSGLRRELPKPPPAPEGGPAGGGVPPAGPSPSGSYGSGEPVTGYASASTFAATDTWESGAPPPDAVPPIGATLASDAREVPLGAAAGPSITAPTGGTAGVAGQSAIAATFPKAQFLDRLAAFGIDVLLAALLQALLDVESFRGFVILLLGYHVIFWTLRQTTVGGMILNLRVVRTDGQPLTSSDALIRGLTGIFSIAALGIGCFWILADPDNQAWHDRFAGTWVVKVPKNWNG
jgi:uncharacterized RDD family membrane protein YckC